MKTARTALAVLTALLVVGCGATTAADRTASTDQKTSVGTGSPADGGAAQPGAPAVTRDDLQGSPSTAGGQVHASTTQTKAVISRGQISLRTREIDQARFDLQKLLDGWGGTIANEQSDADKSGRTIRARFELRIPSARFDVAMDKLPGLGTLVDRSRTAEDVTTQVIDNASRIRSQRLSLARIQALLAHAKDLDQVIAIEAQLSQRQADLDSLVQQQKYLADQTSLATIDLYLETPSKTPGTSKEKHSFISGLHTGWRHLGNATAATLDGVGVVLPFAGVLALVVLAGRGLRRFRRSRR